MKKKQSLATRLYILFNTLLTKTISRELVKTNPKEAIIFAKKYFKGKKIVACEIGVFQGDNARDINKHLNIGKFYLIDPYKAYDAKNDPNLLKRAKRSAHRKNDFKTSKWLEMSSEEAVKEIKEDLDFIYIDGNHDYEYVIKELELYSPKVKAGGIISGHDIQYEGVSKALLEYSRKMNYEVFFGDRRDWWIVKPK